MAHPSPDQLADYVADPTITAPGLANHLEQCARCTQDVTELRELHKLLIEHRPESLHTPGPQVWEAIEQALAEEGGSATGPVSPSRPYHWALRTSKFLQIAAVGVLFGLLTGWLLWGTSDQEQPHTADPTLLASAILADPDTSAEQGHAQLVGDERDVTLDIHLKTPPKKGYLAVWLVDPNRDQRVQVGVLGAPESSGHFTIARSLVSAGFKVIEVSRVTDLGKAETGAKKWARGELTPKAPATRPTKSPRTSKPTPTTSPWPTPARPTRGASETPSPTPSPTASSTAGARPNHSPRPRPSTSTQPKRKQLRAQVKACRVLLRAPRTADPQDLEARKSCRELLRWWRATRATPPPQPKLAAPTQLQPEVLPQPSQT